MIVIKVAMIIGNNNVNQTVEMTDDENDNKNKKTKN